MKILELFSGTESFSKVARERGHECFTIDINKQFNPSLCKDIMDLKVEDIPFKPDIIWASPPCQTFSVASCYRHWNKDGTPKSEKCLKGIEIVKKTLQIIQELNPKFFIIENPRGILRKRDFMQHLHRDSVTYCQYGHTSQKPTDLWNNLNHKFKPMCKPRASCHERACRGAKTGIQGIYNSNDYMAKYRSPVLRAIVPRELCLEIIKACEEFKPY